MSQTCNTAAPAQQQHTNERTAARKDFAGKTAVVTGAASGIGRGLADRFSAEGMHVVLADVEQAALDKAEREMREAGADVLAVRTDVSDAAAVEALAQRAVDRFGGVHVLCNNAGVGGGGASWERSIEDWQWVLGVNLWGVINGIRSFVPIMLKQGEEAHIVNTASVAGLIAGAGDTTYTASKFAVVGLSEMLHHELLAASGGKVKVSVLCPALTNTRIIEAQRNRPGGPPPEPAPGSQEAMMYDFIKNIFAGGMAPSEVARQVFEAIRDERFYVLTHPEHNDVIRARVDAVVGNGMPPTLTPQPR
jgi:NAD(P)-dependent dehydrogenase (short-subunit alcohol dehydrogenase family)